MLRRVLAVTSTDTGGIPQSHRDLAVALQRLGAGQVEVWHLNARQRTLTLARMQADGRQAVVGQHILTRPVDPLSQRCAEYDTTVAAWLRAHRFDVVHVHHLGWHGMGLLEQAASAGCRVVVTFHDYYHLCPTVKLLDGDGRYCGGACTAGTADCPPEPMWPWMAFPRLRGAGVLSWRRAAAQALANAQVFTAPHDSVRSTIRQHLDLPAAVPFTVVPHGRDLAPLRWCGQLPKRGQPLEVLVPGHLTRAKGLEVVCALAELDGGRRLHLHLLGRVPPGVQPAAGLTLHGEYPPDDFAERVARIRPHVGAVFSIWNESWCHTLTEMWACGLPVMAFDFPTIAQRIRETGAGWVWPLEDASALYERILALDFMAVSRRTARAAMLVPRLQEQSNETMARRYATEVYGWPGGCLAT